MILKKIKNNNGFALLFAVLLSSLILSIALGVANIAFKEIKFGTSAKDINDAFFAADTGIECALFNDKMTSTSFVSPGGSGVVSCIGGTSALTYIANDPLYSSLPSWSFILSGFNNESCARVTVVKNAISNPPNITTFIVSKGSNIGGALCNSTNANRVERQLEANY
jgi:hypothetical protein